MTNLPPENTQPVENQGNERIRVTENKANDAKNRIEANKNKLDQKSNIEFVVEVNKNKLDLKPNIEFVAKNIRLFFDGWNKLIQGKVSPAGEHLAGLITFEDSDDIVQPQVTPDEITHILMRLPEALVKLSKLIAVSYHTFGNPKVIPVPGFDEDGNFDPTLVELVNVSDFPRVQDHPSRVLVGVSNGTTIYPTPIPKSVSDDQKAVKMYQIHVFLHEFFHTIDYPRRSVEEREKIVLETDGKRFTLQQWWRAFEELLLSNAEPESVSMYAESYKDKLTAENRDINYKGFTSAVAEQICETFVAYILNIISNHRGWTNFKGECFGNMVQLTKFVRGQSDTGNLKWLLMDQLCRATLIEENK